MNFDMFIPDRLIDKAFDAIADVLAKKIEKIPGGEKIARHVRGLHSKSDFRKKFQKAMIEAMERFKQEYKVIDEDLVNTISNEKDLLENVDIQQAFINIVSRPDRYIDNNQQIVQKYFDGIFPDRINRDRVNNAISYFLKCLAESVWLMPEFSAIYSLLFQKASAEDIHKQTLIAETQVRLTQEMRDILLELTQVVQTQHLLADLQRPSLPAPEFETKIDIGAEKNTEHPEKKCKVDWGTAFFQNNRFYGRQRELDQLITMLVNSRCKLIGIFGLGGIGKSAITIKLANQIENEFDYIFGRSLLNPRPLPAILAECIQFLSDQHDTNLPDNVEKLMAKLNQYLQKSHCLIVLDNFEGNS